MSARDTAILLLALSVLPWTGAAGCLTGAASSDQPTLDEVMDRIDQTSRQRVEDARRIDDLQRRLAVLESMGPMPQAAATSATAAPGEPVAWVPAPPAADVEPPPDLPVVHVAPVSEPPEVAVAQAPDTRVAGASIDLPAAPAPEETALAEEDPYQGVGFGNEPGGGYLNFSGSRGGSTTIRLQGTPQTTTATTTTTPTTMGTSNPSGGTPSSAFGALPRIPAMTATAATATTAAVEPAAFDAGLEAYRAGRWQEAIGWFDRAAAQGLDDARAAQAVFYKAEATFQSRDYLGAIGLFERFLQRYGGSSRAPEALLRIGLASERLGDTDKAAETYRQLVDDHAGSGAATTAAERLEAMGTEGRAP
jgi:TolA-binding protein